MEIRDFHTKNPGPDQVHVLDQVLDQLQVLDPAWTRSGLGGGQVRVRRRAGEEPCESTSGYVYRVFNGTLLY